MRSDLASETIWRPQQQIYLKIWMFLNLFCQRVSGGYLNLLSTISKTKYPKESAPPMAAAGLLGPDLVLSAWNLKPKLAWSFKPKLKLKFSYWIDPQRQPLLPRRVVVLLLQEVGLCQHEPRLHARLGTAAHALVGRGHCSGKHPRTFAMTLHEISELRDLVSQMNTGWTIWLRNFVWWHQNTKKFCWSTALDSNSTKLFSCPHETL